MSYTDNSEMLIIEYFSLFVVKISETKPDFYH